MTVETGLELVQTLALGLLWLFLIGRWVGRQDSHADENPGHAPSILTPGPPDHTEVISRIEIEQERTRNRLHKLEGWQQQTITKLSYIDRDLLRLLGDPNR